MKNIANYRKRFYSAYNRHQYRRFSDAAGAVGKVLETRGFALDIAPYLPADKDSTILDIGCGTGALVAYFGTLGFKHVSGIDTGEDQVAVAKKNGLVNVEQADVFDYLGQRPGAFDLITGLDIIEHFTKDELCGLLDLVHTALKPGGQVVFRTPNADTLFPGVYANGDFTHECILNRSSALQLMGVCGFDGLEVKGAAVLVGDGFKGLVQKIFWPMVRLNAKVILFSTGRSTKDVCLSPNLVIAGRK